MRGKAKRKAQSERANLELLPMCRPRDIEIMGYHEQIGLIRFDKVLCHFWLNLKSLKKSTFKNYYSPRSDEVKHNWGHLFEALLLLGKGGIIYYTQLKLKTASSFMNRQDFFCSPYIDINIYLYISRQDFMSTSWTAMSNRLVSVNRLAGDCHCCCPG